MTAFSHSVVVTGIEVRGHPASPKQDLTSSPWYLSDLSSLPSPPSLGKAGREQLVLPRAEEVGGEVGGPGKGPPERVSLEVGGGELPAEETPRGRRKEEICPLGAPRLKTETREGPRRVSTEVRKRGQRP